MNKRVSKYTLHQGWLFWWKEKVNKAFTIDELINLEGQLNQYDDGKYKDTIKAWILKRLSYCSLH